ncbi:hypothetical protein EDC01DRAFT_727282 [Geopyxis carbonaria]|nr:hypothetical protein EDC01DRAFT_727282 [Geopyxis carbonaria]
MPSQSVQTDDIACFTMEEVENMSTLHAPNLASLKEVNADLRKTHASLVQIHKERQEWEEARKLNWRKKGTIVNLLLWGVACGVLSKIAQWGFVWACEGFGKWAAERDALIEEGAGILDLSRRVR